MNLANGDTPRAVVTGMGVYCALGQSVEEFWGACLAGKSVVETIPECWSQYADYKTNLWSPLPRLDYPAHGISRLERMQRDPVALIAAISARQALENSGFTVSLKDKRANQYAVDGIDPCRAGVYMGTGIGGVRSFLDNFAFHSLAKQKAALEVSGLDCTEVQECLDRLVHPPRLNPFVVSMLMPNSVSASVGIKFSLNGPNTSYSVACASGTVALGQAYRAIRRQEVDVALCGGSEYLNEHYGGVAVGFDVARTLVRDCADPDSANRPFDQRRSGFLFSEGGAAVLVVEALDHARARGAPIIAEVTGYAETFDAHSMMSIAPEGRQIERLVDAALADAGIQRSTIDYINTHGTGTEVNDAIEAEVIERLFGDRPLLNSTKSLLGHTIGASGALEAVVTALSLYHQTTHVCRNLDSPIADLNFVREVGSRQIATAMSQSFAFGGHNAAVVMKRFVE